MFEIQKLTRQNKQLKDKVRAITSELRCSKNECDIQKSVVTKAKQQNNRLILEIKELKRRQEEKKIEREEMETRYFNVLRKLQDEIEERKQKYRKLQAKIAPLMDHDSVRLQILNQIEGVHVMEVDQIKMKNNQLKDELLRFKRENYKLEHKIEQDKIQHQNEIRKIKGWASKTQQQHNLNSLTFEVCNQVENRLLLNYQQARKEAEYYKDKYFSNEKKYLQKMAHLEQEVGLLKEKCQFYEKRRERE